MGHWVPMAERLGGTVPAVVLSPDFPEDQLAFAVSSAGVFRSRDRGKSWEISGDGLSSFAAQSITFSPLFTKDRTLFAGAADGSIFGSTDAGDSWTLLGRPGAGSGVVALATAQGAGEKLTVMAGTLADGVFASSNGGQEWKACNSGLPDLSIIGLAMSPTFAKDQTAFVATERGLQMTTDGGDSWRQVWVGGEEDSIQWLAISPAFGSDRTLFAATEREGVLCSADGGSSWQSCNKGLAEACVNAIALSADFGWDSTMVAATTTGIYLSADRGAYWQLVAEETEMILSLAISQALDGAGAGSQVILAGLASAGVVRSEDGGRSWQRSNQGLAATYLVDLAPSPTFASDGTIFAWGLSDGVFRSTDGGSSWEPASGGIEGLSVYSVVLSPAYERDSALYAATSSGIFSSSSKGSAWQRIGLENQSASLLSISPNFEKDNTMVAVTGLALQWSTDGGRSWSPLSAPAEDESAVAVKLAADQAGTLTMLLATWREPLYYRRGRLRVWSRSRPDAVWSLLFQRDSDSRVAVLGVPDSFGEEQRFFIGNGEAVYHVVPDAQERTREGIRPIWLPAWVGTQGRPVVSLSAAPQFDQSHTLVAAGGDGVFISQEDGIRWQRLGTTLGARSPIAVAPSPDFVETGRMFALTIGGRLWKWEPTEER